MKIKHSALPRGPVSHLGGVHNAPVAPQQGPLGVPSAPAKPDQSDIAAQLAAIQSMKAQ